MCFLLFSFENKPRKYRLVQSEQRKQGKRLSEVKYDLTSKVKSQLPEYIQDLMKELVSQIIILFSKICTTFLFIDFRYSYMYQINLSINNYVCM